MEIIQKDRTESGELPAIDLALGLKLAGGNQPLATDMLNLLTRELPENILNIKQLAKQSDFSTLRDAIHKLHGAACYCGVPRLKSLLFRLESDLKNHIMDDLPSQLDQLDIEVNLILRQHSHLHR